MLPEAVKRPLADHLENVKRILRGTWRTATGGSHSRMP